METAGASSPDGLASAPKEGRAGGHRSRREALAAGVVRQRKRTTGGGRDREEEEEIRREKQGTWDIGSTSNG